MRDYCFLYGSASLGFGGRASVQPMNEPIPAGFFRFNPDEPENEANLARSVFVQLKHAVIQARIRRCRGFGYTDLEVYPRAD